MKVLELAKERNVYLRKNRSAFTKGEAYRTLGTEYKFLQD